MKRTLLQSKLQDHSGKDVSQFCRKQFTPLIAILSSFFLATPCFAAKKSSGPLNIYVSPTGNDRGPGTLTEPFKTLQAAAYAATPGSNVIVRGGIYPGQISIKASGTSLAYIRFYPYPGETVILDGANSAAGADTLVISGKFIDFSGFEIRNSKGVAVDLWGTHHVTLTGNTVHDSALGGIWVGHDTVGVSHDNLVAGNTVYNTCLKNSARQMRGGWPAALQTWKSDANIIQGNKVYQNYGEGINIRASRNVNVDRNIAFDNYSASIYIDGSPSTVVQNNFVFSTGNAQFFDNGKPSPGIAAAIEAGGLPLNDLRIVNNIAHANRWGFYYGNYDQGGGMQYSLIANNTFTDSIDSAIHIDKDRHNGNQVLNNISYSSKLSTLATGSAAGTTFGYNCWYGQNYSLFTGIGDVVSDPLLANVGALAPDGYRISAASPCASSAPLMQSAAKDFWGVARAPATSAGAHQP